MTHDHRTVLKVHVESPYTVISPTFHVAHTLRRNSSFLNRSVYNFVRSVQFRVVNRLKTIYRIRRNTFLWIGISNVYFFSASNFTGTVRLFTLPFTRFEISTHTVQLELAFLLCDLTLGTLRLRRVHTCTREK